VGGLSEEEQAIVRRGLTQMIVNMDALAEEGPRLRRPSRPKGTAQDRAKVSNL
jgi:hypothetical protein